MGRGHPAVVLLRGGPDRSSARVEARFTPANLVASFPLQLTTYAIQGCGREGGKEIGTEADPSDGDENGCPMRETIAADNEEGEPTADPVQPPSDLEADPLLYNNETHRRSGVRGKMTRQLQRRWGQGAKFVCTICLFRSSDCDIRNRRREREKKVGTPSIRSQIHEIQIGSRPGPGMG